MHVKLGKWTRPDKCQSKYKNDLSRGVDNSIIIAAAALVGEPPLHFHNTDNTSLLNIWHLVTSVPYFLVTAETSKSWNTGKLFLHLIKHTETESFVVVPHNYSHV